MRRIGSDWARCAGARDALIGATRRVFNGAFGDSSAQFVVKTTACPQKRSRIVHCASPAPRRPDSSRSRPARSGAARRVRTTAAQRSCASLPAARSLQRYYSGYGCATTCLFVFRAGALRPQHNAAPKVPLSPLGAHNDRPLPLSSISTLHPIPRPHAQFPSPSQSAPAPVANPYMYTHTSSAHTAPPPPPPSLNST